jgi:hypothetical protein
MGKFGYRGSSRLNSLGRSNATCIFNVYLKSQSPIWRLVGRVPILSFGEICYAR